MCLFKRDEQENNCVHDECKNYYMLNKQICMYSKQSQEPKQQKPSEDHNLLDLLQKKIKKETDLKSTSQESSSQFSQQPVYSQTYVVNSNAYVPQKMQFPVKTEAPTTTVYYPVMSQPQTMQQQNMHAVPMESNPIPQNFNTMSLNQLIAMRNQNSMESQIPQAMTQIPTTMAQMAPTMSQMPTTTMRPVENVSVTQAFENSMKDFQNKLLNLVLSQNKIMVELKEKNDLIQDTLSCLVSEVSVLKKSIKPSILENPSIPSVNPAMIPKMMGSANDTINTDSLLTYLYGPSTDFQYQLVLKQELSLPLYRERNFRFTVMLVDKAGKLIENTNRIPLTIGIYSSENPPKYIDTNTSGNKILKGFIEKDLKNGTVSFDKIQIKEVTSHFRNGWIFFVVHPKLSNTTLAGEGNPTFVSGHKIRPLVLEKVVVKAKKAKEKNTNVESEENVQEDVEAEAETEQPEKDESAYATSTD